MTPLFAFLPNFGPVEIMIILGIALLIFGARRLPELGRSFGKGIVEFKKGLKGIEDDTDDAGSVKSKGEPAAELPRPPQRITPSGPRFEDSPADKPAAHS
jgi:sec-independent protein translocase protein TatA